MASFRTNTNLVRDQKQIRKLTAIAVSLLMAMVGLTQLINFNAVASSGTGLNATYFYNSQLNDAAIRRLDSQVNFDWDNISPDPSIHNDYFSVRWDGFIEPRYSETYNFYTFSDDGVRLWVDGKLIVDNWTLHPRTENIGYIKLNAGKKYAIKVEYFENTGRSIMQLSWSSPSQQKEIIPQSQLYPENTTSKNPVVASSITSSTEGLVGEYFDQLNFNSLKHTRTDSQVNFDWGNTSPNNSLRSDTYSVRWSGKITPPATGSYTFYTHSDDGVRLTVNNQTIINNWNDHPLTENTGEINLEAGKSYPLKLEYYERYGNSTISLLWSGPGFSKQVISPEYFKNNVSTTIPTATEPAPAAPQPQPEAETVVQRSQQIQSTPTSLGNTEFYVNPYSQAQNWVNNNRNSRSYEASLVEKVSSQPTAQWLGGWNSNIYEDVRKTSEAAANQNKTAVFVAYNIPQRDCGGYSSGGMGSYDSYRSWVGSIAAGIGSRKAIVILEPDALAMVDCLSGNDKENRFNALRDAVSMLKKNGNTAVYLDAGHAKWIDAGDMSERLKKSGIDQANGFALNTSNFFTTSDSISYGEQISSKTGGKHFVIDTSRNGNGPAQDNQWCNPWGRKLGQKPTTNTGNSKVDAYLWIKAPGESDGNCNGGPSAGTFWPEYTIELVKQSGI